MTTKKERTWGDAFYEDPDAAVGHLAQHIEQRIEERYAQEKGRERFWQSFYDAYPQFKNDRQLVSKVLDENIDELANLNVDDGSAHDRIAELVEQRIRASAERHGYRRQLREEDVMRGSPEHGHVYNERSHQKSTTLGDLIRQRRERRQNAIHGA
jgi:hypothetical protein